MTFKLATWNVNSIRIRLDLLKKLAETEQPDIICLQEVKAKKEDCVLLPYEEQNRVQWNAPISKMRGYGFGQSLVWYASEADTAPAVSYVQNLVDAIHAYSGKNYLDIDETNDPALQQWNACR